FCENDPTNSRRLIPAASTIIFGFHFRASPQPSRPNHLFGIAQKGVAKKSRREQFSRAFTVETKYPRRESNPHLRFRKPLFYPLNYGDNKEGESKKDEGRSPESGIRSQMSISEFGSRISNHDL